VEAYLGFADGRRDLALRTEDAASLQNWFAAQLGRSFPQPPVPAGFRLVGGARAELARHDAAVIVYAPAAAAGESGEGGPVAAAAAEAKAAAPPRPTLLFVHAAEPTLGEEGRSTPPVPLEVAGYHQLAWESQPYSFRLVSAEPPARLREFAP
jgi:hypothetical protein